MKNLLLFLLPLCFSQQLIAQNGACIPPVGIDCVTAPNYIDSVVTTFAFSNFSNVGTDCNTQDQNYYDYYNRIASENAGGSFNLHVGLNPAHPSYIAVWIDWNDDLTFSAGEQVYFPPGLITTMNVTVNVPMTAVSDTLILRVRSASTSPNPCDSVAAGETEDYRLIVIEPNGIAPSFSEESWTIYPNPANDFLTVDLGENSGKTEIAVIDLLGNVVVSQSINTGKTTFDLSEFAQGVYFVRVNSGGNSFVKKFVH